MRFEQNDPSAPPHPLGMPAAGSAAFPVLRCEVTQLEVGDSLEEAQRYAETVASRLEAAVESLEALGVKRHVTLLRVWLERWLGVVELLFEARLEERQALFGTRA